MTDSKKFDLILEKISTLDEKVTALDEKVTGLEKDMFEVKVDLRRLHRDDEFIIDEVERAHEILTKHTRDKSVRTA